MDWASFHTSTFGSNSDGAFDAIATLYCQENDKQLTPSNVVSHDVSFSDDIDDRLYCDVSCGHVSSRFDCPNPRFDVALATSKTSLLPPPRHRSFHLQDVSLATSQTSLLEVARPRLGGGKRDILEVARETSWRWQERHLEVARETSWRWKERR
jgi:hypothetical protein